MTRHIIRLEGDSHLRDHRMNQRNLIRRSLEELLKGIGQEFDFRGHSFTIEMDFDGVHVTAERDSRYWEGIPATIEPRTLYVGNRLRPVDTVDLPPAEPRIPYYGD